MSDSSQIGLILTVLGLILTALGLILTIIAFQEARRQRKNANRQAQKLSDISEQANRQTEKLLDISRRVLDQLLWLGFRVV
jgi:beta-lactamase regulating signal transducer with metallopeptidase domain